MKFKILRLLKAVLLSTMIATTCIITTCITQTTYADETTIPEEGITSIYGNTKAILIPDGTLRCSIINGSGEFNLAYHFGSTDKLLYQLRQNIKKMIFDEGVISISHLSGGGGGSYYPYLEEVKLPESCTQIGNYAFNGCTQLKKVKLSSNTTMICDSAFKGCSQLKSIKLPPTATLYGYCFNGAGLKTIDLPAGITLGTASNNSANDCFRDMPAVENIIIEGDINAPGTIYSYTSFVDGVMLKKIVYLSDNWYGTVMNNTIAKTNINTTIYCTESNYDMLYEKYSAKGVKFVKISGLDDLASSAISDDNVTLDDILYDIEEVTDGDELEVPIEGSTNMATVRITVPTEVGFVIAPNTKSKFITKPFKIVNQTGAPIIFTLNELKPTSASNALKTVKRTYKNRTAEDWSRLSPEETEEGIALNCTFDVTGGNNFTSTTDRLWVDPDTSAGDITELKLSFDADAEITGKLGGLYGLAWDDEYTGSYALKGTVKLGYTDEDPSTPGDPVTP